MNIRAASADDVPALVELGAAVVPATYDAALAEHTLVNWWSAAALSDSVDRLPHWVAEDDDRVVGVANLGEHDGRPVMWKLYVHPEAQGRGVGSALLDEVLSQVDGDLWLEVSASNHSAAAFYRAHGFEEVRRDPQPPYPDQVWMRRA